MPLHPPLADIERRAMDPKQPAGFAHARAGSVIEHTHPLAEQHVILRHAAHSSPSDVAVEGESEPRTGRRPHGRRPHLTTQKEGLECLDHSVTVHSNAAPIAFAAAAERGRRMGFDDIYRYALAAD